MTSDEAKKVVDAVSDASINYLISSVVALHKMPNELRLYWDKDKFRKLLAEELTTP